MLRMRGKRDPTHSREPTQHGFLSGSLLVCIPGSPNRPHPVWAVLGHPTLVYSLYYLCCLSGFLSLAIAAGGADAPGGSSTP